MEKTKLIPHLDGWRGIAISAVLIAHFCPRLNSSWIGELGVQLFFVLSGYLMSNLLFIKKVDLASFFWRRLARVLPTFVLYVLTMAVYASITGTPPQLDEILATLTFLRTYLPAHIDIWNSGWAIGNLWSLNVEEHSYIYLAAVALIARWSSNKSTLLLLLAASIAAILTVLLYYPSHPPAGAANWDLRTECAALGLIAAATIRVVKHDFHFSMGRIESAIAIGSVIFAALCYSTYQHKGVHLTMAPIALAIGINFLDKAPRLINALLSSRQLCWIGTCSFSVYLWQQPFYLAVKTGEIPEWLGFGIAMLIGVASYYLLENPARKRLNQIQPTIASKDSNIRLPAKQA
ncbi:MAG: acyltransferase [Pseudomonadota bacterium]